MKYKERDERPWGFFDLFFENQQATFKFIKVNAGKRTSYQSHNNRDEIWIPLKNSGEVIAEVTSDDAEKVLGALENADTEHDAPAEAAIEHQPDAEAA